MNPVLTETLFTISNLLLGPLVVLLLILAAWSLLNLGGVVSEAVYRFRRRKQFSQLVNRLKAEPELQLRAADVPVDYGLVSQALAFPVSAKEKVLDDFQLEFERRVRRLQVGVRLGPLLGLIGTLIPLGPAMLALSSGDISTLSQRLVVAFTTTVLGLMIGGIAFTVATFRRSWYSQDINDLEFLLNRIS